MRHFAVLFPILLPYPAIAQPGEEQRPRIVVNGAATIPSPPDRAVVSFSVHGEGAASDEAVRAMETKRDAIEKGLASVAVRPDIRAAPVAWIAWRSG